MSTIQTVIDQYEEAGCDDTYHEVFFLEESPEVVKASAELQVTVGKYHTITRTVYSLEEYMKMQTRPLSDFCPPAAKKGIWWLAVDPAGVSEVVMSYYGSSLDYDFKQIFKPLTEVRHFHVTLAYDVNKGNKPEYRIGYGNSLEFDRYPIKVTGLAYNDKCAALVVEVKHMDCCNKHPHITLATAEGVPPVYSNDMLAGKDGAYNFLPLEAELEGTLEFFQFQ